MRFREITICLLRYFYARMMKLVSCISSVVYPWSDNIRNKVNCNINITLNIKIRTDDL